MGSKVLRQRGTQFPVRTDAVQLPRRRLPREAQYASAARPVYITAVKSGDTTRGSFLPRFVPPTPAPSRLVLSDAQGSKARSRRSKFGPAAVAAGRTGVRGAEEAHPVRPAHDLHQGRSRRRPTPSIREEHRKEPVLRRQARRIECALLRLRDADRSARLQLQHGPGLERGGQGGGKLGALGDVLVLAERGVCRDVDTRYVCTASAPTQVR